jgi:hypothetical protein
MSVRLSAEVLCRLLREDKQQMHYSWACDRACNISPYIDSDEETCRRDAYQNPQSLSPCDKGHRCLAINVIVDSRWERRLGADTHIRARRFSLLCDGSNPSSPLHCATSREVPDLDCEDNKSAMPTLHDEHLQVRQLLSPFGGEG